MPLHPAMSGHPKEIFIVVPGFWTFGAWWRSLKEIVEGVPNLGARVVRFRYRNYGLREIICLFFRRVKGTAKLFKREYEECKRKYPECSISVVAHSHGTRVVATALSSYELTVKSLVLAAPVLSSSECMPLRNRAQRILIDMAKVDWILLGALILLGQGRAGLEGPYGLEGDQITTVRRNFWCHNGFFTSDHISSAWVPFFLGETPPRFNSAKDDRPPKLAGLLIMISPLPTIILYLCLLIFGYRSYARSSECPWYPELTPRWIAERVNGWASEPFVYSGIERLQPPHEGICSISRVRGAVEGVEWAGLTLTAPSAWSERSGGISITITLADDSPWRLVAFDIGSRFKKQISVSQLIDAARVSSWRIESVPREDVITVWVCARREPGGRGPLDSFVSAKACRGGTTR